jgi:hypothetical protein
VEDVRVVVLVVAGCLLRVRDRKLMNKGRRVAIAAAVIPIAGSTMDHFTRFMPNQE